MFICLKVCWFLSVYELWESIWRNLSMCYFCPHSAFELFILYMKSWFIRELKIMLQSLPLKKTILILSSMHACVNSKTLNATYRKINNKRIWGSRWNEKRFRIFLLYIIWLISQQNKRRLQEEIEKKRRNIEEEKLKLQYLKVYFDINNNYNTYIIIIIV